MPAAIPLTGPNGGLWVKVDTLTVATRTNPTAATGVQSNVVLDAGTTYLAVASGTARIANDATGFTDAEFIRYNKNTGPQDGSSPGFAWNNHGVRLAGVAGGTTTGNLWGTYQSDHQYIREVLGQGTKVTGYYSDLPGYYGDNSGTLTVDLYAEVPVVSVTAADTGEGSATGGFTFTRTGDLSGPLTVTYSVGATATPGADYTPLTGTVTFAAGENSTEVPVEAFGDNTADDGETVTATIETGTGYALDTAATTATVVINDQALTVSVQQVNDAEEGILNDGGQAGTPGLFRFIRAGDLTAPLTVAYTVSGTATAGSDYATLTGTVTFGIGQDAVDVAVNVIDDADAEPTETVTVTLTPSDGYQFGNDADTLFVRDNDTTKYIWVSEGSIDWNDPLNWSTGTVPTSGSDVYFDGYYSTVDCINVGDGLSALGGLHLVNGYPGTATLANALSVGDFEEASGTLNQPVSGYDLTVSGTMLWTGGTLNALDSGAVVNVSGAVGRLSPPDTGSLITASTINFVNHSSSVMLPGVITFVAGRGMLVDAELKMVTGDNAKPTNLSFFNSDGKSVTIGEDGAIDLVRIKQDTRGVIKSAVPWGTVGELTIQEDIRFEVFGHYNGANRPSFVQGAGKMTVGAGGQLMVEHGAAITGGSVEIKVAKGKTVYKIIGDLIFAGDSLYFTGPNRGGGVQNAFAVVTGTLSVDGNMTLSSGLFIARINQSEDSVQGADALSVKQTLSIGTEAKVNPILRRIPNEVPEDKEWWIAYYAVLDGDEPGIGNDAPLQISAVVPPRSRVGVLAVHSPKINV